MTRSVFIFLAVLTIGFSVSPGTWAGPIGYVAMSGGDTLVPFDIENGTSSLPTTDLDPEANGPYDVSIHPLLPQVWVVGKDGDGLVIVNRNTGEEITRLDLATSNTFLVDTVFSPDGETAFISDRDARLINVIDVSTHSIAGPPVNLETGFPPGWMAVQPRTGDIYVTEWQGTDLVVIDGETLTTTRTTLGSGFRLRDLAFSPDLQTLYIANGVGNDEVLFLDPDTLAVEEQVSLGESEDPWAVAVTPDGTQLFTANQDSRDVSVIDVATLNVDTIDLTISSAHPRDLDIAADGSAVFVPTGSISGEDGVFVIDPETHNLLTTYRFTDSGSSASVLAVAPQSLYERIFADRFESN